MKTRYIKIICSLGAAILFFIGCEETMDIELSSDATKKLVVEGGITTDTTNHTITLSWSDDYFSVDKQQMATNASVSIHSGNETFILEEISPGVYQTSNDVYGKRNHSYTLHIALPNGNIYEAQETINPLPEIDSITHSENYNHFVPPMNRFGFGYDIFYYGYEPPGTGDFYMWNLYLNDILYTDTITEILFTDDEFVDGNYIRDFDVHFIREEDIKQDTNIVTLEMKSISREHYDFLVSLMLETVWKGSPWDGPPANVPSNISNNGLGYFYACDVKRSMLKLIHKPRETK